MGKIRDLEIRIREYINHYRQTHVLVQNLVKWNILCSSLDVVGDTELALGTYRALKEEKDDGFIAPSKAWERGIPCERMKPFERIQLVKVQSG